MALPLFVLAAGEPPPSEVDLGAMKLKRANAPASVPGTAPATTSLPAVQRTTLVPGRTNAAAPAPAPAAAPAAAQANTNAQGIGNVVQTPLKNRASDILNTSTSKPDDKTPQNSNEAQVKMPSLFRRP